MTKAKIFLAKQMKQMANSSEEVEEPMPPKKFVSVVARRKLDEAVLHFRTTHPGWTGTAVIIAADTIVSIEGKILGKPVDDEDAFSMLRRLSGRWHKVYTGVQVAFVTGDSAEVKDNVYGDSGSVKGETSADSILVKDDMSVGNVTIVGDVCVTDVRIKNLKDETIKEYIFSGESHDKAGAYAIQGLGQSLVECYDGDYNNIVGLPTDMLLKMLQG